MLRSDVLNLQQSRQRLIHLAALRMRPGEVHRRPCPPLGRRRRGVHCGSDPQRMPGVTDLHRYGHWLSRAGQSPAVLRLSSRSRSVPPPAYKRVRGTTLAEGGRMVGDKLIADIESGGMAGLSTAWIDQGKWPGHEHQADRMVSDVMKAIALMRAHLLDTAPRA
ncbi:hypothetical protein ACBR40_13660 [Nonomuraea sp. AD125B]